MRVALLVLAALAGAAGNASAGGGPPLVWDVPFSIEEDVECDDWCIAASVHGDATACKRGHAEFAPHWPFPDCVAFSGTGDATCTRSSVCYAVSLTGDARGKDLAVSLTGQAEGDGPTIRGCDLAGVCALPV